MFLKERQQIIVLASALVIAGGFILFRYLPLRKQTKLLESKRSQTQSAVSDALAKSQQLSHLKEKIYDMKLAIANYETNIPTKTALGEFLQQMAKLMDRYNLSEQLVEPKTEIETEQLNCIPVSLRCKGSLEQLFGFFRSLQESERLIRIVGVEFSNDNDFKGNIVMQTDVVIYYRPQATQG